MWICSVAAFHNSYFQLTFSRLLYALLPLEYKLHEGREHVYQIHHCSSYCCFVTDCSRFSNLKQPVYYVRRFFSFRTWAWCNENGHLFHDVWCLSWEASVTEAWSCVGIFILMSGSCCWLSAGTSAGAVDQSLCVTCLYGLGFLSACFHVVRLFTQQLTALKTHTPVEGSIWLPFLTGLRSQAASCLLHFFGYNESLAFKGRGWLHLSMGRWRRACRMGDVVAAIFGKYSLPQSLYLHTWLIILLFSHLVMSDSASPWIAAHQAPLSFFISQNLLRSCLLGQWCYLTISSSATPFSFCLPSFPAHNRCQWIFVEFWALW